MEFSLRRKLTLRAHGQQVVFVKKKAERLEHVLMKAFLWALYLPSYPDLSVEIAIGDKYKPDVVSTDPLGRPVFWGEAGKVSDEKITSLTRRFRTTHFALAKWAVSLRPHEAAVAEALARHERSAPFDLLAFPPDSPERFIDRDGTIRLCHDDLVWKRL